MTKQEKEKMIAELFDEIRDKLEKTKEFIEELEFEETEETEETEKTVAIPNDAIVVDKTDDGYCPMKYAITPMRLSPYQLACTVGARIPNAKWAAVDRNGHMYWYESEPIKSTEAWNTKEGPCRSDGLICQIPCPIDDWESAKWRIR